MISEKEPQELLSENAQLRAHVASFGQVHPGVASPRETWPDDTEINTAMADEDSSAGALFEIAEKYHAAVTNNYPRWQYGVFIREIGDFITDLKAAAQKHLHLIEATSISTRPHHSNI